MKPFIVSSVSNIKKQEESSIAEYCKNLLKNTERNVLYTIINSTISQILAIKLPIKTNPDNKIYVQTMTDSKGISFTKNETIKPAIVKIMLIIGVKMKILLEDRKI